MNKNIFQSLKIVAIALTLSVGISYVSAWTAPIATPPNSNVSAPINVSSTAQIKTGDLSAWNLVSNGVVTNNAVVTNSIAGNTVATNNLVVATGAAAGKVLTSDASGNATWQPASAGSTYAAGTGLALTGNVFSVNPASVQTRVSGTCAVGSSIRVINANGTVSCETDDMGAGGGDNLGNHTATQGLNMSSNYLYGLAGGNSVSWGATAGSGNSIYSDGAGGNMAVRTTGMFYVQNPSAGNANMSANDYYIASTGKWASTLGGATSCHLESFITSYVSNNRTSKMNYCASTYGAGWVTTGMSTNGEAGAISNEVPICSRVVCP